VGVARSTSTCLDIPDRISYNIASLNLRAWSTGVFMARLHAVLAGLLYSTPVTDLAFSALPGTICYLLAIQRYRLCT